MIIDRRFFRIGAIGRNITSDVVLELSEEIVELIVRGRNIMYIGEDHLNCRSLTELISFSE